MTLDGLLAFLIALRTPYIAIGSGISVRQWDFSYGTSSCITYFKIKEHLTIIKQGSKNKFGRCDDLAIAVILFVCHFLDKKLLKTINFILVEII